MTMTAHQNDVLLDVYLSNFPLDVQATIASYVSDDESLRCYAATCRSIYQAANSDSFDLIWKRLCERRWYASTPQSLPLLQPTTSTTAGTRKPRDVKNFVIKSWKDYCVYRHGVDLECLALLQSVANGLVRSNSSSSSSRATKERLQRFARESSGWKTLIAEHRDYAYEVCQAIAGAATGTTNNNDSGLTSLSLSTSLHDFTVFRNVLKNCNSFSTETKPTFTNKVTLSPELQLVAATALHVIVSIQTEHQTLELLEIFMRTDHQERLAQNVMFVEQFALLVAKAFWSTDLLLSSHPQQEEMRLRRQLDKIADRVKEKIRSNNAATTAVVAASTSAVNGSDERLEMAKAMNQVFFKEMGFTGNSRDYYNVENSLLDWVLVNKTGIPMSLAIIYVAVARRVGIDNLEVMGLPGHIVVGTPLGGAEVLPQKRAIDGTVANAAAANEVETRRNRSIFVDVFHDGNIMGVDNCRAIVEGYGIEFEEQMLQAPLWAPLVLQRVVNNIVNAERVLLTTSSPSLVLSKSPALGKKSLERALARWRWRHGQEFPRSWSHSFYLDKTLLQRYGLSDTYEDFEPLF